MVHPGGERQQLVANLRSLTALLEEHFSYREPLQVLHELASDLESGDPNAPTRLQGQFGGMGSLNDFYLTGNPTDTLSASQRQLINAEFNNELEAVYEALQTVLNPGH